LDGLVRELTELGVICRRGDIEHDVEPERRSYFERWLSNRDGFVKFISANIDYIGIEEVMRMGAFFDVHCLIENQSVSENDDNSHTLFQATPYFTLRNGILESLGWSGGVLAGILSKDQLLNEYFRRSIMEEQTRKISVRVANYACLIQTRIWEYHELVSIFDILDRIALNINNLAEQIHLGENI
jgi:hypothetical protein